ncbi:MAG: hypothetical protein N5P05_001314 [Chroococcopsis gigantea SAG 12.99]|jgi:phosphonate transport system substrate-binding protein|nr:PhnD/SsuA/transferrin family substrate-binding protein [Chlorogloea purpurea SAG 13.99]MDV2999708.1 hypothetical protein [Chroococcopsis gigantea SAG 12.99]
MKPGKPIQIILLGLLVAGSILALNSCQTKEPQQQIIMGLVHFQNNAKSNIQLDVFKDAIEEEIPDVKVELTNTNNYDRGVELICEGKWDVIFAMSPVVAAKAVQCGQIPVFQAYGKGTYQSWLFVRSDSPLAKNFKIEELTDKTLALNQVGSASGYVVPVHTLCGATVKKIGFLGDYDKIKNAVASNEYDIGAAPDALIEGDTLFPKGTFTVVAKSMDIPKGAILFNPHLSTHMREKIKAVMAGIPPAKIPKGSKDENILESQVTVNQSNYRTLGKIVKEVDSLGEFYKHKPVKIACQQYFK